MDRKKFNWQRFQNSEFAVNCRTASAAEDFLAACAQKGMTWCDGEALDNTEWCEYREETCYDCCNEQLSYCDCDYFLEKLGEENICVWSIENPKCEPIDHALKDMPNSKEKGAEVFEEKEENRMPSMGFTWETFKAGEVIAHCPTWESCKDFMSKAIEHKICWWSGDSLTNEHYWDIYQSRTCYCITDGGLQYSDKNYYAEAVPEIPIVDWEVANAVEEKEALEPITSEQKDCSVRDLMYALPGEQFQIVNGPMISYFGNKWKIFNKQKQKWEEVQVKKCEPESKQVTWSQVCEEPTKLYRVYHSLLDDLLLESSYTISRKEPFTFITEVQEKLRKAEYQSIGDILALLSIHYDSKQLFTILRNGNWYQYNGTKQSNKIGGV